MKLIRYLLLITVLLSVGAFAQFETGLRDAGSLGGIRLTGSDDPNLRKVYIVQLKTPSAADFYATRFGQVAKTGTPTQPRVRFDKASSAIQGYTAGLAAEQDRVLARAGAGTELIYRYQYGLNGFAARMHPSQAHKLENLPDVLRVWEDEIRPLATNYSLDFAPGLDGDGVIIGVIDSGIAPEHPALADTREADRPRLCRGDWAENSLLGRWLCRRFDKLEDTLLFEPPENWNGSCQSGDQFEPEACNNKLIGRTLVY